MTIPLRIMFHGIATSESVERCARLELDKLERLHPNVEGCRLELEARSGNRYHGGAWCVHLALAVPGRELAVDHDSGFVDDQEDQLVTIRSAFVGARRLLLVEAKRLRDDAKARIAEQELVEPAA